MTNFYKCTFVFDSFGNYESDILASLLGEIGFDSFDNDEQYLNAYIQDELYNKDSIGQVLESYPFEHIIKWDTTFIEGKDWNEEWEKESFKPILINDICVIHSTTHKDYKKVKYDICINPRMSFGTGSHETTTLMIKRLLETECKSKNILDVGTGTGILSILCSMKGAQKVIGIELDPTAAENAESNVLLNKLSNIKVIKGDILSLDDEYNSFDLLLANINRNVLLHDMPYYSKYLKVGGLMQLSGFYSEDIQLLTEKANSLNFDLVYQNHMNEWNILVFKKERE